MVGRGRGTGDGEWLLVRPVVTDSSDAECDEKDALAVMDGGTLLLNDADRDAFDAALTVAEPRWGLTVPESVASLSVFMFAAVAEWFLLLVLESVAVAEREVFAEWLNVTDGEKLWLLDVVAELERRLSVSF